MAKRRAKTQQKKARRKGKPQDAASAPDDKDAIAELRKLGARVDIEKHRGKAVVLKSKKVNKDLVRTLRRLQDLKWLFCPRGSEITEASMAEIGRIESLEGLTFNYTPLTDAALDRLRGLTQLRHLGLIATGVSKQAMQRLQEAIPELEIQTTNPFDEAATAKEDIGFKCPVARCYGDLSFVDDGDEKPFWGCGECGSVWYDKKNLMSEITAIIERYSYRRRCYAQARDGWRPASPSRHPKHYQDLVLKEEGEARESFVRG